MFCLPSQQGLADSLWTGTILSGYLMILTEESNTRVGVCEAAQGLAMLVFALPIGAWADRTSKSAIIGYGGFVVFAATAVTTWAVVSSAEEHGWEAARAIAPIFLRFFCSF